MSQWNRIRQELRRGSSLGQIMNLGCDLCHGRIDTSEETSNLVLLKCGHVCHQRCVEELHNRARNSLGTVLSPCCNMQIQYEECDCPIPYYSVPEWYGNQLIALEAMQGGTLPTTCFNHAIQLCLHAIAVVALDRLGGHLLIGVTDSWQTCLFSAQGACFGQQGFWSHSPSLVSGLVQMCKQESTTVERAHSGRWGDYETARNRPHFTIGVMPEPTGDLCWNCQQPGCTNGARAI